MINRLISPTSGKIFIDDRDTGKGSSAKLRRGIGYVIQHAGLFPHRTVVDNVATVPFLLGVKKGTARTAALELLERVGLPAEFADRYPAQLSGGQQQRVGVARALAADPPVMLMDEPFSAVDPVVRAQLQDEFLRLQAQLGKTIIFVTHDIDEAIKMGDQVAVLRVGGKLAQLASPAELLSHPTDAFVAGFVGRDRGYRALGFAAAGALGLRAEAPIGMGAELARAAAQAEEGWVLVVDNDGRPQGWLAVDHANSRSAVGQVVPELLNLGGTLATESGTLRELLDSALSSPSGRGVVVHPDGRFAGTVTASQVLERIEEQAAASRNRAIQAAAARDRIEIPGEHPVFDQFVEESQDTAVAEQLQAIEASPDEAPAAIEAPPAPVAELEAAARGRSPARARSDQALVGPAGRRWAGMIVWTYFRQHQNDVLGWLWTHTWLSVLPIVIGFIIALPLGWLASRFRWSYPPIVTLFGLIYTLPSLALFVVMPGLLHTQILDKINVVIALSVYTVALLVRVIADALNAVPPDVRQAAAAMGFRGSQRFYRVDLPLAITVIAAGLRVAVVSNVSLVAVATLVGVTQLGQLFSNGQQLQYFPPIILGIILCLLLALVLDVIVVLAARTLTPWRRAVR